MNELSVDGQGRVVFLPPAPLPLRFTRPNGDPLTPADEQHIIRHRSAAFGRYLRRTFNSVEEAMACRQQ